MYVNFMGLCLFKEFPYVGRMGLLVALLLPHIISYKNELQNLIDKNKHTFLGAIVWFNTTSMLFSSLQKSKMVSLI